MDPDLLLALLNVAAEAELQREIRDIIDELDIILHIANQQKVMVTRFVKFAKHMTESDLTSQQDRVTMLEENAIALDEEMRASHHAKSHVQLAQLQDRAQQCTETVKLLKQQQTAFDTHSDDLVSEIQDRINELSALKDSAESTAQNVSPHYCRRRHFSGRFLCNANIVNSGQ